MQHLPRQPRSSRSFKTQLRLALAVVVLIATGPVVATTLLRIDSERQIEAAQASVRGLDQFMLLTSVVNTIQVTGATYAREPAPFSRKQLQLTLETARVIEADLDYRSREERVAIRGVISELDKWVETLEQEVEVGRGEAGSYTFIRAVRDQGIVVSGQALQRAQDAARSQQRLKRSIHDNLVATNLLLGAAAVILGLVAWLLPRRLVARLELLEQATRKIAAGDLAGTTPVAGRDEVGKLARSFDAMGMALLLRDTENRQLLEEQVDRSTRDSLTGLRNNRFFHTTLADALEDRRSSTTIAVLDLDNFKQVNDTYGHAEGDEVLRRMAMALTSSVRSSDTCCRLGGEEFGIILRDCDEQQAAEIMQQVALQLRATDPPDRSTTFSCGVATHDGDGPDELFKRADECAYEAKRAGKDRIVQSRDLTDDDSDGARVAA